MTKVNDEIRSKEACGTGLGTALLAVILLPASVANGELLAVGLGIGSAVFAKVAQVLSPDCERGAKCPDCGRELPDSAALSRHRGQAHPEVRRLQAYIRVRLRDLSEHQLGKVVDFIQDISLSWAAAQPGERGE